jgi:anti-anti-sigma regulatory factor
VTLLDSSGTRTLVRLRGRAAEGHRIVGIICPRLDLRRIIEVVGLADGFAIADDLRTLQTFLDAQHPTARAMAPVA